MIKLLNRFLATQFGRFFVVGTIGFLVDAGILQFGMMAFGLGPLMARVPSFLVAVLITWILNRNFTFKANHKTFRESFPLYLSTNAVGIAINFAVYTGVVLAVSFLATWPVLALAIASIAAMFFNFAAAKFVVFRD